MSAVRRAVTPTGDDRPSRLRKPVVEGFRVHRVGLEIDKRIDQRTWYEFGKLLQQIDYARDWILADWLAFGEHEYGDKVYQSAARLLGKSPRTWEDYAYIARNVGISERSEILPLLLHKPVARFSDRPALQRKLIAIAEEYGLSKNIFEAVIELFLEKKNYEHLLTIKISPVERARLRAEKERTRVLKRAQQGDGEAWLEYAREQAEGWQRVLKELEGACNVQGACNARRKPGQGRAPRPARRVTSATHGRSRTGAGA